MYFNQKKFLKDKSNFLCEQKLPQDGNPTCTGVFLEWHGNSSKDILPYLYHQSTDALLLPYSAWSPPDYSEHVLR